MNYYKATKIIKYMYDVMAVFRAMDFEMNPYIEIIYDKCTSFAWEYIGKGYPLNKEKKLDLTTEEIEFLQLCKENLRIYSEDIDLYEFEIIGERDIPF